MAIQKDAEEIFAQIAIERGFMTAEEVAECRQVALKLREMKLAPRTLTQIAIERNFITRAQVREVNSEMRKRGYFPRLGGFEILGKVGSGGMGNVYKARQISLGRVVALKVLPRELASNPIYLERFRREARMAAQLTHANAVLIYDVGDDAGRFFLVMEYVEGAALDKQLEQGAMEEARALEIVRDIAKALSEAHSKHIIHRDIKPGNILLRHDGAAKLADLGIAKDLGQGQAALTRTGVPLGTPAYMSPEQCSGRKDIDHRTDIYSLGVTLFQMVTGRMPYTGPTPLMVMRNHIDEELPDPSELNPQISGATVELIRDMTAKDRESRPDSSNEIVKRIENILGMRSGEIDLGSQLDFALSPEELAILDGATRRDTKAGENGEKAKPAWKRPPMIAAAIIAALIIAVIIIAVSLSRGRAGTPAINEPVPIAVGGDVNEDENDADDIEPAHVHETIIERVSVSWDGTAADGNCFNPAINTDGRFIVFVSRASNLAPDADPGGWTIYVRDRLNGQTDKLPIAVPAGGGIPDLAPAISGDGRYVVFSARLPEHAPDGSSLENVFLYDRVSRSVRPVSRAHDGGAADGASASPAISADGVRIVFASNAGNLVEGTANRFRQIYIYDATRGEIRLVSANAGGEPADAHCGDPAISAGGARVAFVSAADNLLPGAGENKNVFLRDLEAGSLALISAGQDGSPANGDSARPALSADGRFVAFESLAANLVARDFNRLSDVFVFDRRTSRMERVSVGARNIGANGHSYSPSISADGRYVAFVTDASNIFEPRGGIRFVALRDRTERTTELIGAAAGRRFDISTGRWAAISADGRRITFHSESPDLLPNEESDGWGIYLWRMPHRRRE